jgi:hypothetical protein
VNLISFFYFVTNTRRSIVRLYYNTRKLPDRENSPLGHWARGAGPLGLMVLWCFSLQVDRRSDGKREESPREVTSVSSPSEPLIGVLLGVLTSMPATKPSAFLESSPRSLSWSGYWTRCA